jgi:DNA-binding SARP family transcriptional activator
MAIGCAEDRPGLGFAVLGPVRAWRDGVELALGTPQQRATLALLLLNDGKPLMTDEIADAVWGEAIPAQANATIRTYVHRLRRVLRGPEQDDVIAFRNGGYRLRADPLALDVGRFSHNVALADTALGEGRRDVAVGHLRTALSLHRGTPLAGISGAFVESERARLMRHRLAALETTFRIELDRGAHAEIVEQLQVVVGAEPLREPLRELLILALYRAGRQAEALLAYEDARQLLRAELGTAPGPALRLLHGRMLRSDPGLLSGARTSAPVVHPAQLPADLPVFVGREDALAEARAGLPTDGEPDRTTVTVVRGQAGVGKTAFALHWAHEIADRFPDGQLYVDLGVPADPQDTIRGFLRALGTPVHRLPSEPEEQTALYRSLLADRRCLIVLDGARESAQVLPLLPGRSRSLVVVTSRAPLDGLVAATGARTITLALLGEHAARDLLARRLGAERIDAEPETVHTLVERCAGLPLALSIVCARISAQPLAFPLVDVVAELFDTDHVLDAFTGADSTVDLRAVLASSYAALSPEAARLFRLLAPHPGAEITASVLGMPVRRTRALLREIADAQLLSEVAPGRFAWHDLLRAYAGEQPAR